MGYRIGDLSKSQCPSRLCTARRILAINDSPLSSIVSILIKDQQENGNANIRLA
jgi:hypothetical protein